MPERPSRASAFSVLRTLDGQPVTGLIGISEAATEGRECGPSLDQKLMRKRTEEFANASSPGVAPKTLTKQDFI